MFNRQPFNTGSFNTSNARESVSGVAAFKMGARASGRLDIVQRGRADMALSTTATGAVYIMAAPVTVAMAINTDGAAIRHIYSRSTTISMKLMAHAASSNVGESSIILENLVLDPGGELIINTCEMTIIYNSENGMDYFTMDSDFFKLMPGENILTYEDDSGQRNVLIDVIWKDRYI